MVTGVRWKSKSDLGWGRVRETERDFGQSSEDNCEEYVARLMPESMAS